MLNQEEIQNILAVMSKATITGAEATTVALLQQKLNAMLIPTETKPEERPKKK